MENLIRVQSILPVRPGEALSAKPSTPLAGMQIGDTVTAQVVDTDASGATLALPDGTKLHASMQAGQSVEVQDSLQLRLSSTEGGAARLRLLSINSQPISAEVPLRDIELMQLRLPASRANLAASSLFHNLQLPLTADTMARYNQIMQQPSSLLPEQAAVLAASDIPLNSENIEAFAQFLNAPVQAEDFAAALREALGQAAQGDPDTASVPQEASAAAQSAELLPTQAQEGAQAPEQAQPNMQGGLPMQEAAQQMPAAASEATLAQAPAPAAQGAAAPSFADTNAIEDALRSIFPKLLKEESSSLARALQKAVPSLASRVASLSQSAAASGSQAAKQVGQLGTQLVQQMQFGNEMSSLFYTQIPFTVQERESSAELYILKRQGGDNKIDADNATIALCLNTQNMGTVESLLQVKQQELSFCFRVEDRQIRSFLRSEVEALAKIRFPSPYVYRGSSVTLIESPITPVNAAKTMRKSFGMAESSGIDISI